MDDNGDLNMLPEYPIPYTHPKKFKNTMAHHLRYFRFTHKTDIETG